MQLQHFSSATLFLVFILRFACAFVAQDRSNVKDLSFNGAKNDQFLYKAFLNGHECEERGADEIHCTLPAETKGEELKGGSTLHFEAKIELPKGAYFFYLAVSFFANSACGMSFTGTYTFKDHTFTIAFPLLFCTELVPSTASHTSVMYGGDREAVFNEEVIVFGFRPDAPDLTNV